jgi:hypothetical protein
MRKSIDGNVHPMLSITVVNSSYPIRVGVRIIRQ